MRLSSGRPATVAHTTALGLAAILVLAAVASCGGSDAVPTDRVPAIGSPGGPEDGNLSPTDGEMNREPAKSDGPLVLFLGDSLTAGYGLAESEAFPAVLETLLAAEGHPIRILNAGVSGDTSAGGLRRLDWLLSQDPRIVVVELGANDGLRGLPLEHTEDNLRQILVGVRRSGAVPLLVGMQVPPNYGPEYAPAFAAIFPRLADSLDVPLVEFLLDGVGGRPELNLADGIHPTAEGHLLLAENVLPQLRALVVEMESGSEAIR